MSEFNPFEKPTNFSRELVEEGPHAARCARVIEIGIQESPRFGDKEKVVVVFSLPNSLVEVNGEMKQRFISKGFGITFSNAPKSDMVQYARALCPRGGKNGNVGDFLDQPCQIIIRHEKKGDRIIEVIDGVSPVLPGTEIPPLDTEPFWFSWNNPKPEYWAMIPDFTKKLIMEAGNYPGSYVEEMVEALENMKDPF